MPSAAVDIIPRPGEEDDARRRLVRALSAPVEAVADAIMADIRVADRVSALAKLKTAVDTLEDLARVLRN